MRHAISLLSIIIASMIVSPTRAANPLYGQQIGVPKVLRPDAKAAVQDLEEYLKRLTGQPFTVSTDVPKIGILLRRADETDVPAGALKAVPEGSKEAFVLWPDGDRLWLVGRTDLGLTRAVYAYLEHLGCRWYFPSDRWTIVPERKDIRLSEPISRAPAFKSRVFAGSGGFGGGLQVDPTRELQARWVAWQRRNSFGGEFALSGHSGEGFNTTNRKILEEHPEYMAMVDGKRVPWSIIAKFCPANKDAVDLFVKDRLAVFRQQRKIDPEGLHAWAVSVEPADGGGHCESPEAQAIGSISDRVFHVANVSAKAIKAEFPDGWVSLYAYNQHAAVPTIPLEPNVYVQVIPYAFQRTGLTPDELLDAWSKKVPRMGVYDYWSIPDWSHDLPTFDYLGFGPKRLRDWHARHVDSFNCESTYSSGAMGPAWYISVRLAWNPKADPHALFDEFLKTCFGPAEMPMRRMLVRWTEGFHYTSHELARSFRDVGEALKLAEGNPTIIARIADYGRYLGYLRLYFEYLQADPKGDAKQQARERLVLYVWGIYDSTMIHSFRASQLFVRDGKQNQGFYDDFAWNNPKAAMWGRIKPVSDEAALQIVRDGVKELQPLEFATRQFKGELVALSAPTEKAGEYSPPMVLSNTQDITLLTTRADQSVVLRVACEQPTRLTLRGHDGKRISEQVVKTGENWSKEWSEVKLTLPKPGTYQVNLYSPKRTLRISIPLDISASMAGWFNSQGQLTPRLYFYVPKGVARVAIHAEYTPAGPPRFFDPSGKAIKPELHDKGKMILFDVPEDQRGAVWSLERAACPLGPLMPLNIPSSFALHRDALLVPKDALQP